MSIIAALILGFIYLYAGIKFSVEDLLILSPLWVQNLEKIWLCILTELSPVECRSAGQRECFGYERGAARIVAKHGYKKRKINIDIAYAKTS